MKKKFFVVADVHGFFNQLKKALDEAGFDQTNEDHVFVSLGDLLDRGRQPLECLKFVNSLPNKVLVRGNHEDLMEELLARREYLSHDIHNGTVRTIEDMTHIGHYDLYVEDAYTKFETHPEWKKYITSCVDYYETQNNIFVHGWIPCTEVNKLSGNECEYNSEWRQGDWAKARWYPGWNLWEDNIKEPGKTILCGHWHCSAPNYYVHHKGDSEYGDSSPFVDDGIVCLDAFTVISNRINCYVLEDEEL